MISGEHLAMIHINTRSLSKHFEEVKNLIEGFSRNIQIIAVSETWMDSTLSDLYEINEYNLFCQSRHGCRGGGVALYVNMLIELSKIVCGVSQGSILGPKLFLLYVKDIFNIPRSSNMLQFAGDTNLFFKGKNSEVLYERVNRKLDKLSDWFSDHKLPINANKSEYMAFQGRKTIVQNTIHLKNDDEMLKKWNLWVLF